MSNKRPKNFDAVILQQQKQLDAWFAKNESRAKKVGAPNYSDELRSPIRKSPRKMSSSSVQSHEYLDHAGSPIQGEVKSPPTKTNTMVLRDRSRLVSPSIACTDSSPIKNLILNETSDASIDIIKEEFDDMFHNISNFESFEMVHDFNDMIISPKSLKNVSHEYSPAVHQCLKIELETDGDDNIMEEVQNDPLYIGSNERLQSEMESIPRPGEGKKKKRLKRKTDEDRDWCSDGESDEDDKSDENYILSKSELKTLRFLLVELKHEVPPQHQIERSAGTHSLSTKELEAFRKYGHLKSGPFSSHEDQQLKENWSCFCKVHNWDEEKVQPFLSMRHNRKFLIRSPEERKNFVKFLARDLPWRTLHSVYSRFKILFNTKLRKGPYTPQDDEVILTNMHDSSQRSENDVTAEVAKLLKRTRRSVLNRFQKLKKNHDLQPSSNKISIEESRNSHSSTLEDIPDETAHNTATCTVKWTVPLVEKFLRTLLRLTDNDSVDKLECKMIDEDIWKRMQKIMNINYVTLQKYWYLQLYMQIFSPKPIIMNEISMKLLRHLRELGVRVVEDVNWKILVQNFDGVTPYFLSLLLEHLLQDAQTTMKSDEQIGIFDLYGDYEEELKKKSRTFLLPKINYSNGEIVKIDTKGKNLTSADPFNVYGAQNKCK